MQNSKTKYCHDMIQIRVRDCCQNISSCHIKFYFELFYFELLQSCKMKWPINIQDLVLSLHIINA